MRNAKGMIVIAKGMMLEVRIKAHASHIRIKGKGARGTYGLRSSGIRGTRIKGNI